MLCLASGFAGAAGSADDIVAKMGAVELKRADVKRLAESQGIDLKGNQQALALEQSVRTELVRRYVLGEAKQKQWDKRPDVQAEIERAREQVLVTSYMNDIARPPAAFPTDAELQVAYEANKARFVVPVQYRVAQIYIGGAAEQSAGAERKAEEAWKKVNDRNANFADIARALSEHKESAAKGGEMNWLPEDQLLPELRSALKSMSVGNISKPVKSQSGWHVVKLLERKEAGVRSLSEVRESLAQALRLQRAQEKEREYMNQIVSKHPITVNEIALSGLLE
jgi:peptidylprolyl isomerase